MFLKITYTGDVAQLYCNGSLFDDEFYMGRPWEISLKNLGNPAELTLLISELKADDAYLETDKNLSLIHISMCIRDRFNFLTVPVAVPQRVGEGRTAYTIDEDATVLSEYWNMTKKRGKVTGNRFTRLEKPDALKKGLIEIDGQAYQSLDTFADEYLGYEVEYYLESCLLYTSYRRL